ncbi:hypothetical protein D3C73_1463670 [compost metagenome]
MALWREQLNRKLNVVLAVKEGWDALRPQLQRISKELEKSSTRSTIVSFSISCSEHIGKESLACIRKLNLGAGLI